MQTWILLSILTTRCRKRSFEMRISGIRFRLHDDQLKLEGKLQRLEY